MASDSERDISVGGLQIAPTSLFTGVDYAALGHLHGRQTLTESVRYSGSPLAYSFSEAGQTKGSWLVDLGPGGVTSAEFLPAPVPRRLARLRGRLEDLLAGPARADAEDAWLQVTLTDPRRPLHAMERIRARFPHTLVLAFEPEGVSPRRGPVMPRVDGRSDLDVALGFVDEVRELEATHRGGAAAPAGLRLLPHQRRPRRRLPARTSPRSARASRLMRLHRLTVTAFGPFAGTEEVDFDELNDAGLFLLTGSHRRRQEQPARRGVLRPLRHGPRRARHQDPEVPARPPRHRARGGPRLHRPGPPLRRTTDARVVAPQAARRRTS